ncbi:MAG: hypothetical protein M3Y65_13210 [Pseudomonadota bacterium]|nr:hypothetical protein [Pseudomonadota bacterium]
MANEDLVQFDVLHRARTYEAGVGPHAANDAARLCRRPPTDRFAPRGTAAAGLIEAELVRTDGKGWIANACTNPELFRALKDDGGSSLGVVTRLTLRTRDLPESFDAVSLNVNPTGDATFKTPMPQTIAFYASTLANPIRTGAGRSALEPTTR